MVRHPSISSEAKEGRMPLTQIVTLQACFSNCPIFGSPEVLEKMHISYELGNAWGKVREDRAWCLMVQVHGFGPIKEGHEAPMIGQSTKGVAS